MLRKIILSLFVVLATESLQADYVIVKQTTGADGGPALQAVGPDDLTEDQQHELYRIMMTYEWPMSSAAYEFGKITREEAEELFASGVDSAEQNFIRRKIQTSELLGPDFDLVFVPKTLYELMAVDYMMTLSSKQLALFVQLYAFLLDRQNYLVDQALRSNSGRAQSLKSYCYGLDLDESTRLSTFHTTGLQDRYRKIASICRDSVMDGDVSTVPNLAHWYCSINQAAGLNMLLALTTDVAFAQEQLKKNSSMLAGTLAARIRKNADVRDDVCMEEIFGDLYFVFKIAKNLCSTNMLSSEVLDPDKIVYRLINFEYACQEKNVGWLIRSATNTSWHHTGALREGLLDAVSCLFASKIPSASGYSLSYGNSLFAGMMRDPGACTYNYLLGGYGECYVLEIDKKEYVFNNGCDGLFFIPPYQTLFGLMGKGELFHARTCMLSKEGAYGLRGINASAADTASYLRLFDDSFKQELLFQTYFINHAHFLISSIDAAMYFRASRAAISAMKAVWEDDWVTQKQLQLQKNKAGRTIMRMLRKRLKDKAYRAVVVLPHQDSSLAGL